LKWIFIACRPSLPISVLLPQSLLLLFGQVCIERVLPPCSWHSRIFYSSPTSPGQGTSSLQGNEAELVLKRVERTAETLFGQVTFKRSLKHLGRLEEFGYLVMFHDAVYPVWAFECVYCPYFSLRHTIFGLFFTALYFLLGSFLSIVLRSMGWGLRDSLLLSAPPYGVAVSLLPSHGHEHSILPRPPSRFITRHDRRLPLRTIQHCTVSHAAQTMIHDHGAVYHHPPPLLSTGIRYRARDLTVARWCIWILPPWNFGYVRFMTNADRHIYG